MLPATLVTPAIRPLFVSHHAGDEGAMHAFMAMNMLGGAIGAPLLGRADDALGNRRALLVFLTMVDAVLLGAFALHVPTSVLLVLRTVEGAAHVGAASILMGDAAVYSKSHGGRVMGMAALAVVLAIACGSFFGGLLLTIDARMPFVVAGMLALFVALSTRERPAAQRARRPSAGSFTSLLSREPELWVPLGAAFVGRFVIGCLVVTFALFAHRAHGYSDKTIGFLFSLVTVPFALASYPAGRLLDRIPRAAMLVGGALLCAAALAGLGWVPRNAIGVSMLLFGIGSSMIFVPVIFYGAQVGQASERATVMALVHGAGCVGMLLGPTVAGIVSAVVRRNTDAVTGYRAVFLVACGVTLGWVLASAGVLARRMREEAAELRRIPEESPRSCDSNG
ncbi:MFS transporter [Pendulispora rubella]|uniref:MFS transporter n=1 Tax=Pendulispora rubella TaxID=2741070 RepID=A0ABZ2LPB0_9BACT